MKLKKASVILLILLSSLLFVSCWDKQELEEQAYVLALGLDYSNEEGYFDITMQIANPQGGGGANVGRNEQEPPDKILTITLPDIISAKDTATAIVARNITFDHLKYVIVGEKLALTAHPFKLIEGLLRDPQVRRKIHIIVSRENAKDFINAKKSTTMTRPHKYYELMIGESKQSALVPQGTLMEYMEKVESDEGAFLAIYATSKPYPSKLGNEDEYIAGEVEVHSDVITEVIGSAIFKEGKMIGTLTGEETKICLLLRPNYNLDSILATYDDPLKKNMKITAKVEKKDDINIEMNLKEEVPVINITLKLKLHILTIQSTIDYVRDNKKRKLLQEYIKKSLLEKFKKLINKTQTKYKVEPFDWEDVARKQFLTVPDYIAFDWMKSYPNAKVNFDLEIYLEGFGKQLSPPNLKDIKD